MHFFTFNFSHWLVKRGEKNSFAVTGTINVVPLDFCFAVFQMSADGSFYIRRMVHMVQDLDV